jgi:hypothetical protein
MSRPIPTPRRLPVSSPQQQLLCPLPASPSIRLDVARRALFARRLAILLRRVLPEPYLAAKEEPHDDE